MVQTIPNPVQAAGPPASKPEAPATRRVAVQPANVRQDAVELSEAGQRQLDPTDGGVIRSELVNRVRQEISDGTYLTDEKLNAAIDRMVDRVFGKPGAA